MKNKDKFENPTRLSKTEAGDTVEIVELLSMGLQRRRMLDLGLLPGTVIDVIRKSPLGDPVAYNIRGALIALRQEESDKILVKFIQ
ncbi:FeoA family protein [Alkaliphilus oremlandii]|uniref:FeoA family protein n=1 Tax=Alkaliphilus oremlandii (strain OhILAs) TaxID=350688 RepID=A8MI89_ALKOO|nr:FeoA family protein [Alkaliphilus oremlandii]ABW19521.1 FeoA family protein [Alkaliphilus oremlandii OhILAs]